MDLDKYQEVAGTTNCYPPQLSGTLAMALGLTEEAGEVAGKISKVIRDDQGVFTGKVIDDIKYELGDVLWQVSQVAARFGISLEEVAEANLKKLASRMKRNVIAGSGDFR